MKQELEGINKDVVETNEKDSRSMISNYLLLTIVWKQSNVSYIPDIKFNIKLPGKDMNENDLLKLRLESVENKYEKAQTKIEQLSNEIKELKMLTLSKWRQVVYEPKDTGVVSANPNGGGKYTLARLVIPKKIIEAKGKYRFMARYSAHIQTQAKGGHWIYYECFFGGKRKVPTKGGHYLFTRCDSYPFPLSHNIVIEIDNSDGTTVNNKYASDDSRALEFCIKPDNNHPCGASHVCIECYQL